MGYAKGEKILRCKLAALFRLIELYGWSQNIYNHITVSAALSTTWLSLSRYIYPQSYEKQQEQSHSHCVRLGQNKIHNVPIRIRKSEEINYSPSEYVRRIVIKFSSIVILYWFNEKLTTLDHEDVY